MVYKKQDIHIIKTIANFNKNIILMFISTLLIKCYPIKMIKNNQLNNFGALFN